MTKEYGRLPKEELFRIRKKVNELLFSLEDNSYWFNHRNNCICETVRNFPPPDNTIIDIGSGNGFVSNALNKIGIETICV